MSDPTPPAPDSSPGPRRPAAADTPPGESGGDRAPQRAKLLTPTVAAWAWWDWGGASFNAVITTFVFTVYLTSSAFGRPDDNAAALGLGMTIAGIIIALLAPITGQRADRTGRVAPVLTFQFVVVLGCIIGLYAVRPDPAYLWLGVWLITIGNIFYEFAGVLYNALLPSISTPQTIGRVSGLGWGAGYLGGIVLLLFLYVAFIEPEVGLFGVTSQDGMDVRISMLVCAVWFALSSLPLLVVLHRAERGPARGDAEGLALPSHTRSTASPEDRPGRVWSPRGIAAAYLALWHTIRGLARTNPHTLFFLLASAVFRDGLAGVFTFGGIIAAGTFGFSPGGVIVFGIVANVVAGIATIAAGALDDALGPKRVIVISLSCMILAGFGIFLFHDRGPTAFWVLGLILTIFVGPAQSASRSLLGRVIPPGREGEIFGLYATTGRAVSPLSPALFAGFITFGQTLNDNGSSGGAQHWGILGIMTVLILGLGLLLPVRPQRTQLAPHAQQ